MQSLEGRAGNEFISRITARPAFSGASYLSTLPGSPQIRSTRFCRPRRRALDGVRDILGLPELTGTVYVSTFRSIAYHLPRMLKCSDPGNEALKQADVPARALFLAPLIHLECFAHLIAVVAYSLVLFT